MNGYVIMLQNFGRSVFLLLLSLSCANACDLIAINVNNKSAQNVQLQSESKKPLKVLAQKKQSSKIELGSYKDKFCSIIDISFDNGDNLKRYVIKPKQKSISILINKHSMIISKGLTGPLKY